MASLRSLLGARRGLLACFPSGQERASRALATSCARPSWLSFSKEKEKTSAHSKLLSKDTFVYELVTDHVIPARWEEYLENKRLQVQLAGDSPDIK